MIILNQKLFYIDQLNLIKRSLFLGISSGILFAQYLQALGKLAKCPFGHLDYLSGIFKKIGASFKIEIQMIFSRLNSFPAFYVICFFTLLALFYDLKSKRIPIWLTSLLLSYGLISSYYQGGWLPADSLLTHTLFQPNGFCLAQSSFNILLTLILWGPAAWKGNLDKGDFYLLLGIASASTCYLYLNISLAISLMGFLWALFIILFKRKLSGKNSDQQRMPYCPTIALGVLFSGAAGSWSWLT